MTPRPSSELARGSFESQRAHITTGVEDEAPYQFIVEDAIVDALDEYTRETTSGHRLETIVSRISGKQEDFKIVTFTTGDESNPKNWSKIYKWYCTAIIAFTCFAVAFDSAVITADFVGVADEFGVSNEVALLTITVFVIGFGVGPLVFAPLSEVFGRRPIYAVTIFVATMMHIPCALSGNIGTLIACRAIAGLAISAPMTLVGGSLADLWRNEERGVPMAFFSAAPFAGPGIGPLVGGFLSQALGWRWLYWIQVILTGACWLLISFTVPETYAPSLLARRAKQLRKETGDGSYQTEATAHALPLTETVIRCLKWPFQLLFQEIIVFLFSIYMSLLYGLLYMFFIAYPIVYQEGKGWSAADTGLTFIPLVVGVVLSACCAPLVNKHYLKKCAEYSGAPPPEVRLIPMMFSCWLIPIGLFIFAWTSFPDTHWAGPMMGGFPVGFGFIFLYNSCNNYLVDVYTRLAASALAAKTFLRSIWGACVVLFTIQIYNRLGYQWASTLLAFLSLACCAIPYFFYFYGARIRAMAKYACRETDESP